MSQPCIAAVPFVELPPVEKLIAIFDEIEARRLALRKPRRSKLSKYIPFIYLCLSHGRSYEDTCRVLSRQHQVNVSRSALCRFIQAHPLLRTAMAGGASEGQTQALSGDRA